MIRAAAKFFREGGENLDLTDQFDPNEPEIVQVVMDDGRGHKVPVYSIVCNEQAIDELSYTQLTKLRNVCSQVLDHDIKFKRHAKF